MKRKVKRIVASLLFCILLIGCGKFFRYILVDDTASYTRVAFHEMYGQDNIDVLFVGSSHCYRSFIPEIFDKELGMNTFNGGTSSQAMDGSYMVIKEAVRHYDVKHIYLEVYYDIAFLGYQERTDMTQTYIISDYLKPSLDKTQYLLNASAKEYYPNSFILARRNWINFFDADYVKNLLIKKGTDAYKNYGYEYITGESEWYVGKGYVASNQTIKNWDYFSDRGWGNIEFDDISEDWLCGLWDIIAFCNKEDIPLTLVSVPMPDYLLAGIENYDEYVELIQSMIEDTNVNYYDFNLCREEYFPNTSFLFQDVHHMNCYGAEVFSHLLAKVINGKLLEKDVFYDSYTEKLGELKPTVFGVSYSDIQNDNGGQVRNCKIVSNENLEYEIKLSPEGGEPYKVQDFSNNRFFCVLPDEHGVISVTYREIGHPNEVWTINVSY